MAILARLKALFTRSEPERRVGTRQATTAARSVDQPREDALRAQLVEDPNNMGAFRELAELVRRRADGDEPVDPLIAEHEPTEQHVSADVAIWALAEELAGSPRAWYPLVELGRLSLHDDHEGAMRRFAAACERETTGVALVEGVRALRGEGMPTDGLSLGVGHWSPADHVPEAGRQIVRAALEAERPLEARRHLGHLAEHGGPEAGSLVAELEPVVAAAEQTARD